MATSDDSNIVRGNWGNKMEFILSLVAFSVGFGNVWRFPYLCYRNGGGVFLIPYFVMLVLLGIPLYFLELAVGQYSSCGPVAVWKVSPLFKGIGLAMVLTVVIITYYYNMLVAYVIFYLFASMTSELPWTSCDNDWNTPECVVRDSKTGLVNSTFNVTNVSPSTVALFNNLTITDLNASKPTSPAEEYFERYVLQLSSGIGQIGEIKWQLFLCYLLTWIIIYVCSSRGIKSSGKVVYFTATFPYLVLVILLVRGLTLPGAFEGLKFFIVPQWKALLTTKIWGEAASQVFFSFGPAWGCLIVYASYNKFSNDCHLDAVVACLICAGTSLLAGSVVFSIIGFMAHDLELPIGEVMASGAGLVFVAYPEALSRMPVAPFWSISFFFMLLTVGIDGIFAPVEVLVTLVMDEFPKLTKRKWLVTLIVCLIFVVMGLPLTTKGGFYILNMLDWYAATFTLVSIAIAENMVFIYVYGYQNLAGNIELMLGYKPNVFIKVCWYCLTPLVTTFILIFNILIHVPVTYNNYNYPPWAVNLGILIGIAPLLCIPAYMIYYFGKHLGSFQNFQEVISLPWTTKTLKDLTRPEAGWGPMLPQHRRAAGLDLLEDKPDNTVEEKNLISIRNVTGDMKEMDPQLKTLV